MTISLCPYTTQNYFALACKLRKFSNSYEEQKAHFQMAIFLIISCKHSNLWLTRTSHYINSSAFVIFCCVGSKQSESKTLA